uniref:autotransporter outer membrane beta-barrel domain-containing protein n=1 Tax=Xanthomonas boreopolis TaxID=86183 RepID=UPI003D9B64C8
AADLDLSGAIGGSGGLSFNGSGTLGLNGDNAGWSGGLTLGSGTLDLGSTTALGTGLLDVTGNANLTTGLAGLDLGNAINLGTGATLGLGGTADLSLSGAIGGNGGLNFDGTGTLTLGGANTYLGDTTIASGTLAVNGSIVSTTTIGAGAMLTGTGSMGDVILNGALNPGSIGAAGTLTTGSLFMGSGSLLNYDLGVAGVIGGGGNDLISVNGNLTLDGTLNVVDIGGFGPGVYRLIDYTGALTNNGLDIGTVPGPFSTGDLLVQTGVANQVNLVVDGSGVVQFWDGVNYLPNGSVDGGAGIWTMGTTNWTNANGTANSGWVGGFAVFQGTGGTVTVVGPVDFSGMQFAGSGYTIAGGLGGVLNTDEAQTIIRVDPNLTGTISASIGGTGGLVKNDAGTLVLSGANTFTGGVDLNAGTLTLGNNLALGTGSLDVLGNANLTTNVAGLDIGNAINLGSGITLGLGGANDFALSGMIGGGGGLSFNGTGTLSLAGANTFTGGFDLFSGTLSLGNASALGTGALDVLGNA